MTGNYTSGGRWCRFLQKVDGDGEEVTISENKEWNTVVTSLTIIETI